MEGAQVKVIDEHYSIAMQQTGEMGILPSWATSLDSSICEANGVKWK